MPSQQNKRTVHPNIKTEHTDKFLNDILNQVRIEHEKKFSESEKSHLSQRPNESSFSVNKPQKYDNLANFQSFKKTLNGSPHKEHQSSENSSSDSQKSYSKSLFKFTNSPKASLSSKSELNSSSSSTIFKNNGFKLADFRREFKRSVNDLNKNVSKSINALDFLGKNLSLESDTTATHQTFASDSSNTSEARNKTKEENFLKKLSLMIPDQTHQQIVHTNMMDIPIMDVDNYALKYSTSFSSNSDYNIRIPKNIEQKDTKLYQSDQIYSSKKSSDLNREQQMLEDTDDIDESIHLYSTKHNPSMNQDTSRTRTELKSYSISNISISSEDSYTSNESTEKKVKTQQSFYNNEADSQIKKSNFKTTK